jgi:hypothetical protein
MLMFIGCDTTGETLSAIQRAEEIDFGDPYMIAQSDPPRLEVRELYLTVQYSGGCADHKFDVRSHVQNDTSYVWLQHDGNGDSCEAYLTDPLNRRVPLAVLTSQHILLLGPEDQSFTLR